MRPLVALLLACGSLLAPALRADGPQDNIPANVRRIPKLGVAVPADKQQALEAGLAKLRAALDQIKKKPDPLSRELWPDVEVYHKAVHDALAYQEFFDAKDLDFAAQALAAGQQRADQLLAGQAPWAAATGLVVRGFVSRLDGSVQPYGLVVPAGYSDRGPGRFRLDLWFHGRGETLSELNFLRDRQNNRGTFAPEDTLVLHPYGRYSNAFKFAGEADVLEALESAQRRYRVDAERIGVRGFSMGGAGVWHFAVHHGDRFFAANPGAGFSETPEFLKIFQQEELRPTWWEQKLWHWYDAPDWAINLRHCPTVAYSGELDVQKQAADRMERELAGLGLRLTHVIGPATKHAYEPRARDDVDRRMASLARDGRQRMPELLTFDTWTLRYPRLAWVAVDELTQHWERGSVRARLRTPQGEIEVQTKGVTALSLQFAAGDCPFDPAQQVTVVLNGQRVSAGLPGTDRSLQVSLHDAGGTWRAGARPDDGQLRKRPGLTGPIDDAFFDSFLFVRPTGQAWHAQPDAWSKSELERASEHWRRHFRGQARVKDDRQVNDADLAEHHLVLWGDPGSNAVLARLADKLPIRWTREQIVAGDQQFPADRHAVAMIYPNPLNPRKYVVLNSSFTFREYAYLNNARQVPMLPDWAIVDLATPPNSVWPGKIAAANFFTERWTIAPQPDAAR